MKGGVYRMLTKEIHPVSSGRTRTVADNAQHQACKEKISQYG